jgi:ABC-type bacteriocin/lantibiotic exporter with double-glycine peptidase domain
MHTAILGFGIPLKRSTNKFMIGKKILIVGSQGSGKSWLAKEIGGRIQRSEEHCGITGQRRSEKISNLPATV